MFLADLHIHSSFSDGKLSISQLVDLYGSRGFGAIAITDHICETNGVFGVGAKYLRWTVRQDNFADYIEEIQKETERAWDLYRMVVLPGFEITKNSLFPNQSAHLLVIGCDHFLSANDDIKNILINSRDSGALTAAAHPVNTGVREKQTYQLWNRREELSPYIDAWEVASGEIWFNEVAHSGLPMVANSDLHYPQQIQSWKTVLECERHPEAIIEAVRRQEVDFKFYRNESVADCTRPAPQLVSAFGA